MDKEVVTNMSTNNRISTNTFTIPNKLLEDTFQRGIEKFFPSYTELTSKPELKVAILTCIDCRIVATSFGIETPGKAIFIRTAGALMTSDTIRNLLIAIYKLGVVLVAVVGHSDCGGEMSKENMDELLETIANTTERSPKEVLQVLNKKNSSEVFFGFQNVKDQVIKTVEDIIHHPLIPAYVDVQGYLYHTQSGKITRLTA